MKIGVKALGTCPKKSLKANAGQLNVPLDMFGARIVPGQFAICDADGIVLLPSPPSAPKL